MKFIRKKQSKVLTKLVLLVLVSFAQQANSIAPLPNLQNLYREIWPGEEGSAPVRVAALNCYTDIGFA